MSMATKLLEAQGKGVMMERDRCMRVLINLTKFFKEGVNKKLMTAEEKHIAKTKSALATAIIGAIQIQVMSGADPDAKATTTPVHGRNPNALGKTQRGEDGGDTA